MLAYAASRPRSAPAAPAPTRCCSIIAVHVALLAVADEREDGPAPASIPNRRSIVDIDPTPQPPPPDPADQAAQPHQPTDPARSASRRFRCRDPPDRRPDAVADPITDRLVGGPASTRSRDPIPSRCRSATGAAAAHAAVRAEAALPASKLLAEEEATLTAPPDDRRARAGRRGRSGRPRRSRLPRRRAPAPDRPLALQAGERGRPRDRPRPR